ncbi:putative 39S ribosomal protein L3, mitochondrial-like [Apostichopus japonicus]|uniref:Large ribosomal subunit protein uL3m n=1 Tax=Stichopus japonicus TaxID=307972 RepID=A0A2G8L152_STIJA|nr:putative 39S ribosomal protein L3, mitochondrial-like [Apostichopus japonicus]
MATSWCLTSMRNSLLKVVKFSVIQGRNTQIGENFVQRLKACTCSHLIQHRSYYDNTLTSENQKFVYQWNLLKHQFGPSPLKDSPWPRQDWKPGSKRTGLIAVKLGMYPMWTKSGKKFVTTALQIQDCNVIRYVPPDIAPGDDQTGKNAAIEVGAKNASPLYMDKGLTHKFHDACVPLKQRTVLFYVTENSAIQPGTPLYATHFRPGMYVDCCGKTIGKGFQGVMKRWGMKGQPASHGQTKTHRRMGATGGGGSPGRIWKGKKMPGPMGNKWRWTRCLKIWRINTRHNIIFVEGNVSGSKGGFVKIKDSLNNRFENDPPPFPTHYPEDGDALAEELYDEDLHEMLQESVAFEEEEEEER